MQNNNIDLEIEILEQRMLAIENSSTYSLVDIPGNKSLIFDFLIDKLIKNYNSNTLFEPHEFTLFDNVSNFSVLHLLPIEFTYRVLFETDILHPKTLAKSNDEYLNGAEINLLQALYFYKTFYVKDMTEKEYNDTFTLLCLTEPNILFQPVDVEDSLGYWEITPFIEFCSKEGFSVYHIGKAISVLEEEDKNSVKQFLASNIYNFELYKPILNHCSKNFLIEITHLKNDISEYIMSDFFEYIYSRPSKNK